MVHIGGVLMLSTILLFVWMILGIVCLIAIFNSNFFSFIDSVNVKNNINREIDGLRFFLALGVAYHHFVFFIIFQ